MTISEKYITWKSSNTGCISIALARTLKDLSMLVFNTYSGMYITNKVKQYIDIESSSKGITFYSLKPVSTIDGAVLKSTTPNKSWAKYVIKKGLPKEENEKVLAIENEPHFVDGFSGVIKEGYGKGTKTILIDETVIVKLKGRSFTGRLNYHIHNADKAGLHYDLVVEGVPENTKSFEINIPRGDYKGRYAFTNTERGMICIRMKDRSIRIAKPDYTLKNEEVLNTLQLENTNHLERTGKSLYILERKLDGSLFNIHLSNNRAAMRSHREGAEPYYDKFPQVEFLHNTSPFSSFRFFCPAPDLDNSIFQGEMIHSDGAARVGGLCNANPVKSRLIQKDNPAQLYIWDMIQYKGKDISKLPYSDRRSLYEQAVKEIRIFNKNWHVIEKKPDSTTMSDYYFQVINDKRGLPWSEGIVIKKLTDPKNEKWIKIKNSDTLDLKVVEFIEGKGKFVNSVGAILVEAPNGRRSEVGSFKITDEQRQWIWDNKDILINQIAEIEAMELNSDGAVRAGRFNRFHPSKSDVSLIMYTETIAEPDQNPRSVLYAMKSAAGWHR